MIYWDTKTIDRIRHGYFSAVYFNKTKEILLSENNTTVVTMQLFQKQQAILSGISPVISLFQQTCGYYINTAWVEKWEDIQIYSLPEGSSVAPQETVMHIKGPYVYFAHLESLYLGILARATRIATNSRAVTVAAGSKKVIFFADRFDYFLTQELDGYAAYTGGIRLSATPAQAAWHNGQSTGTIPHALIAVLMGNTITAAEKFSEIHSDSSLIALVDYDNDCVNTALLAAKHFQKKLWGVRLDTAESLTDKSLSSTPGHPQSGVTQQLVYNVRQALDKHGFTAVKIIVSGGFTAEKIALFEKESVPVDVYGVGSSLLRGAYDFTADIVMVNNIPESKVGRKLSENPRLKKQTLAP